MEHDNRLRVQNAQSLSVTSRGIYSYQSLRRVIRCTNTVQSPFCSATWMHNWRVRNRNRCFSFPDRHVDRWYLYQVSTWTLYNRPAELPDSDKGPSATAAIRQMGGASAGEMRAQFKGHANVKKRVLDWGEKHSKTVHFGNKQTNVSNFTVT